jgi:hypothetical protein
MFTHFCDATHLFISIFATWMQSTLGSLTAFCALSSLLHCSSTCSTQGSFNTLDCALAEPQATSQRSKPRPMIPCPSSHHTPEEQEICNTQTIEIEDITSHLVTEHLVEAKALFRPTTYTQLKNQRLPDSGIPR